MCILGWYDEFLLKFNFSPEKNRGKIALEDQSYVFYIALDPKKRQDYLNTIFNKD
jgi:hypothetical protein